MSVTVDTLRQIPYIGASTMERAVLYRQWLTENMELVRAEHDRVSVNVELPADYTPSMRLLTALRHALVQCGDIMRARCREPRFQNFHREAAGMKFHSTLLRLRYEDSLTFAQIAERLGRTSWHITKSHSDLVLRLSEGNAIAGNLVLHPHLLKRLDNLAATALFHRADVFGTVDALDSTLVSTLGMSLIEVVPGTNIVLPSREKCRYTSKARRVMRCLRESMAPRTLGEITESILSNREFADDPSDYDRRFIEAVVTDPNIMTLEQDGSYKLRMERFISDEQRMARIIYEAGTWLTRTEVASRFQAVMGRLCNSVNLSNLRKYDIYSSGDLWIYGRQLPSINHFIADFSRAHRIFTMEELEDELRSKGYPILTRIRAYVTTVCLVDNSDSNHFCHKDFVADYPQYSWRKPGRTGLSNWILNRLRELCEDEGAVTMGRIMEHIETKAADHGLESYIRQRVKSTLAAYCGEDKPFLQLPDERLAINPEIFPMVNFNTIGRRGQRHTDQFERIRDFTVKTVTRSTRPSISLVELLQSMRSTEGLENVNRNSCLRALSNTHMGPLPLTIENVDGTIHIFSKQ